MRQLAHVLCFLSLTACAAPNAAPTGSPPPVAQTEGACQQQGGQWQRLGRAQQPTCIVPYADAGKSCRDSRECQGLCQTATHQPNRDIQGTCAASSAAVFGCYAEVRDGRTRGVLCVD